jgi:hypothetical protein
LPGEDPIESEPIADIDAEHLQHRDPALKHTLDERAALLLVLLRERRRRETRVTPPRFPA